MHGLIGLVDVAELLVAELISNAVRHTEGPAAPRVGWSGAGVRRIGAWDADPSPPHPLDEALYAEDGRGPALVRASADEWGWQQLTGEGDRGKYVRCELNAPPESAGPRRRETDDTSARSVIRPDDGFSAARDRRPA